MSEPVVETRDLSMRFGGVLAVNNVSFDVKQGEVFTLIGPNGAGKTTLMRIVAGLVKPSRGEVALSGVSVGKAGGELRRYIGLVSHMPLLYDNLSGWENLAFFARLYDMQQPDERIEAVLRAVDLWQRRRDLVRTYSRGMIQRLAIGRAILHDPPVLLLDEPDTGLDQSSSQMLHDLIRRLGATSRAILLSTHNLDRALEWADSVCLLSEGKIVYQAETATMTGASIRQLYAEAA